MKRVDYKKDFKSLYQPKNEPEIIDVPELSYFTIMGEGNPNGEGFKQCVEALYTMSYAVKMSYRSPEIPNGYYEYTVFPLEGVWDLIDKSKPISDKDNYKYTLMIRQPDFMNHELFERFLLEVKKKKKNPELENVEFSKSREGLCIQMMHIGSFDTESESFLEMEQYCEDRDYRRVCKTHREIYLSDPRKTAAEKMRTVLRFKVEKI